MYTEIHNGSHISQKSLYFKLNNVLNLWNESEENIKIKGLYAIYKDNICVYVGQSKNIASRLATHIKGKYEEATNIFIFNIKSIGFEDFDERPIDVQQSILDNSEKWMIAKLKPIENIIADMSFILPPERTPYIDCASFSIQIDESFISLTNNDDSYIEYEIDYLCIKNGIDKQNSIFPIDFSCFLNGEQL